MPTIFRAVTHHIMSDKIDYAINSKLVSLYPTAVFINFDIDLAFNTVSRKTVRLRGISIQRPAQEAGIISCLITLLSKKKVFLEFRDVRDTEDPVPECDVYLRNYEWKDSTLHVLGETVLHINRLMDYLEKSEFDNSVAIKIDRTGNLAKAAKRGIKNG